MANFKYRVISRFEYWNKEGKVWTDWSYDLISPYSDNKDNLKKLIEQYKEADKTTFKSIKLKHEYDIEYIDIDTLPKPAPKRKRGRPKKTEQTNK